MPQLSISLFFGCINISAILSNIWPIKVQNTSNKIQLDGITVKLSPWSKMRSAPAGSSVNAQGLTIVYGIPLSRIKSSPCKKDQDA